MASFESSDSTETNVANITISNESLHKSGESIVVAGKGMNKTVKVNPLTSFYKLDIEFH